MRITLIGNRSRDHLRIPGQPGTTDRDGGPAAVAEAALREFSDIEIASVPSRDAAWCDVDLELGGSLTVVMNHPLRVQGLLDAHAFVIAPISSGEWSFDQLELLAGKVAIDATGLLRVVNTREPQPFTIPERFVPLIDLFLLPWEHRHLVPEALLKELKKEHVLLLTKGSDGADIYDHGTKHVVPPTKDLPHVLVLHPQTTLLASFTVHYLRTRDVLLSMRFAQEAVRARYHDPQALPLPASAPRPVSDAGDERPSGVLDLLNPPQDALF